MCIDATIINVKDLKCKKRAQPQIMADLKNTKHNNEIEEKSFWKTCYATQYEIT